MKASTPLAVSGAQPRTGLHLDCAQHSSYKVFQAQATLCLSTV